MTLSRKKEFAKVFQNVNELNFRAIYLFSVAFIFSNFNQKRK